MPLQLQAKERVDLGYENRFVKTCYPIICFEIIGFIEVQEKIVSRIDEIEEKIEFSKLTTNDGGTGASGTTLSHTLFNFFDMGDFQDLHEVLKQACIIYQQEVYARKTALVQKCWGNKLRSFEFLEKHTHINDFMFLHNKVDSFSLHLTVKSNPRNSTVYVPASNVFDKEAKHNGSYFSNNIDGIVTVFPPTLAHYTTPNVSKTPRYSLAMDIDSAPEQLDTLQPEYRIF